MSKQIIPSDMKHDADISRALVIRLIRYLLELSVDVAIHESVFSDEDGIIVRGALDSFLCETDCDEVRYALGNTPIETLETIEKVLSGAKHTQTEYALRSAIKELNNES